MRKESLPLIQTNPYLQDSRERESRLTRSVLSSTAIEGVHIAACRALGNSFKVKRRGFRLRNFQFSGRGIDFFSWDLSGIFADDEIHLNLSA